VDEEPADGDSTAALLCATAAQARPAAEVERDRAELLRLVGQERQAHLAYDADLLVSSQADGFLSIDKGQVTASSPAESRKMFAGYFGAVRFVAWDDLAPPRIMISDDGTLATVIVEKFVHVTARADPAQQSKRRFAWMETWRKEGGAWRMVALASTDAPWTGPPG
jgi:ketosteroid isomerase-like protein